MKLLAIDTSTEACSAAVLIDGEIRERYRLAPREHTHLILPMIDELLRESDLKVGGLDAVAFGRGPGAFTGLRIAAGVVQGIAFGADLPVVPVSSLAALAQGGYRETGACRVLAAIDARIQEVYWAACEFDDAGQLQMIGDEVVCSPEQVPIPGGDDWHGVGSGWVFNFAAKGIKIPIINIADIDSINMSVYRNNFFTVPNLSYNISEPVDPCLIETGFIHHFIN